MIEKHVLDPAVAARLPARVRYLLEECLPFWKEYENNLGLLVGLRLGLQLVEAASCTPEQIREALATAVKIMAARLDRQLSQQRPDVSVEYGNAHFNHELIAECEVHDPLDPNDVSLDDFIRELEEKHGLPPESGAA